MLKVQCFLCEHEDSGFCTKNKRNGSPTKRNTGKRRTCAAYKEDSLRILAQYRKRELHHKQVLADNMKFGLLGGK